MPLRTPEIFIREGSKVADAQRNANSRSTRLGAAYDAVFNLGLAVLCKQGWRCTAADGHHVQGLEAASGICGIGQALFDETDALRDLRNNQYQGIEPSQEDVAYALEVMNRVLPRMLEHLAG